MDWKTAFAVAWQRVTHVWGLAKLWIKTQNKPLLIAGVGLIVCGIPDWVYYWQFWKKAANLGEPYALASLRFFATGLGRAILIIAGFLVLLLESKLARRKKRKVYDLSTVKGRTLKLRDDLQRFLEDVERKWPDHGKVQGADLVPHDEQVMIESLYRSQMIMHGFALRFHERAVRLFHECGEAGTTHSMLGLRVSEPIVNKAKLRELIEDFTWLSKHVDQAVGQNTGSMPSSHIS
ncbi:MAG: hypothetical protein WBV36_14300 [Terriglobales bacterium]